MLFPGDAEKLRRFTGMNLDQAMREVDEMRREALRHGEEMRRQQDDLAAQIQQQVRRDVEQVRRDVEQAGRDVASVFNLSGVVELRLGPGVISAGDAPSRTGRDRSGDMDSATIIPLFRNGRDRFGDTDEATFTRQVTERINRPTSRQKRMGPSEADLAKDQLWEQTEGGCVICTDRKACCIALPCAHLNYCVQCSREVCKSTQPKCAVCRMDLTDMKVVYT